MTAKIFIFFLLILNVADGLKVVSMNGQVLAFVKQHDNQINVASVPLKICADAKKCKYSYELGKCPNKSQYIATVKDQEDGKGLVCTCCESNQESNYHNDDECRQVTASSVSHTQDAPANTKNIEYVKGIAKTSDGAYAITVCRPLCGGDEKKPENKPNTQQRAQEKPKAEPTRRKCFSSDMTVRTKSGTKRMNQVQVGDEVLVEGVDSELVYEPIVWLYHRDPNQMAEFVTVHTASNVLQLSDKHLIPNVPCSLQLNSSTMHLVASKYSYFAHRLQRGNCIIVLKDHQFKIDFVQKVTRERKRGIFSPITSRGTIVVNNVFASCYSSIENQPAQHAAHTTLIQVQQFISRISSWIFGEYRMAFENSDIPNSLRVLLKVAQLVLPPKFLDYI